MLRLVYVLGTAYVLLCAYVVRSRAEPDTSFVAAAVPVAPFEIPTGDAWFQRMKPYCNAVEVEVRHRALPAPPTPDGQGYSAACYGLAGRIDRARAAILALAPEHRTRAANIVFNIGHPVADAGDDKSAGPIMSLVVEFAPDNYMALYHAGVSNYILGERALAKPQLERFLELYRADDGWRRNALDVLERMQANLPPR
ncbi:MAG TPA: hypothetical protein VJ672_01530 [Gemmatimonadaceae bacterium]|nr:hypothetical protein [Gemmatimonadaceae bacterium]